MSNTTTKSLNSKTTCTNYNLDSKSQDKSSKKPFTHHYTKNNLEISELDEAHSNMLDLIKQYQSIEVDKNDS